MSDIEIAPELIEAGKKLLLQTESLAWQWGDLANKVEPLGTRATRNGVLKRLERWAEQIGYFDSGRKFSSLLEQRRVAAAWPVGVRVQDVPWTVHRVLESYKNRVELLRELIAEFPNGVRIHTVKQRFQQPKQNLSGSEQTRRITLEVQMKTIEELSRLGFENPESAIKRYVRLASPAVIRYTLDLYDKEQAR